MHNKPLVWSAILLAMSLPAAAADVLRVAASSSWNLPYGQFENERLTGGIVFDLVKSLETPLDVQVTFVVLPRKRLDGGALSGDYDLRCYLNPKWTEIPDKFDWSAKLFDVSDVVFGHDQTPDPKTLAGLQKGAVMSAVLGYVYPALTPIFTAGDLKRDDTTGQEGVMLKMTARRTPYGVSDLLALDWYQRNTPQHRLSDWRVGISKSDFQCAIPKNGTYPAARIIKALDELKRKGAIEQILQKYR